MPAPTDPTSPRARAIEAVLRATAAVQRAQHSGPGRDARWDAAWACLLRARDAESRTRTRTQGDGAMRAAAEAEAAAADAEAAAIAPRRAARRG